MANALNNLGNRSFETMRRHPMATLAVSAALAILILIASIYFAGAVITGVREAFENRKVEGLEKKADTAVEQKNEETRNANEAAQARKTEDAVRERTIKPEIQRTTRNLETARERTRRAQSDYDKARTKKPDPDRNADTRALHERNCSDLRELYPGEPVDGCQP